MEFVSLMGAARRLGVSRTAAIALASAGMARPSSSTVDGAPVFDADGLDRLAERDPPLREPLSVPAVLVKLGPPGVDESGRKIGYHVDYLPSEARDAARMYWRVAAADQAIGAALVATVAGFVVVVAKISGVRHHPGGAIEFDLTDPPEEVLKVYNGKVRIKTKQGGAIEYLGPWQHSEEDVADAADADLAMDEPGASVSLQQVEEELGVR